MLMRKALSVASLVIAALVVGACGTVKAADTPPETAAATATTSSSAPAASTTTTAETAAAGKSPGTALPVPPPTTVPPLPTTTTTTEPPEFSYTVGAVTEQTVSKSWREGCPLHWEELSLLTIRYWNFDGRSVVGRMVVNTSVVDEVVAAFGDLYAIGFPIERIALVDDYDGDDKAAMRANVTSSFNCRYVDGTDRWSNHAFGLAVDINPLINPWAREGNVLPLEGTQYADRSNPIPGMINDGDAAIAIFERVGWSWGGVWASADYMHFSSPGN